MGVLRGLVVFLFGVWFGMAGCLFRCVCGFLFGIVCVCVLGLLWVDVDCGGLVLCFRGCFLSVGWLRFFLGVVRPCF